MTLFRRIRILPLLVIFALLSFSVRLEGFFDGVRNIGIAYARDESHAPPQGHDGAAAPHDDVEVDPSSETGSHDEDAPAAERIPWQGPVDTDFSHSGIQEELYKDLAARKTLLDERERSLETREALLEAAGREMDQKLRELTGLRNEIGALLEKQSEEEEARIASLVKIYEGMKAKDAARIFNTLDMDVLLRVMGRMSERKSAPILAAMNPDRARSVTILLAEQKQLPDLPGR
ncbi:MAG: flagellar protein FlbB [Alphaproteobacteria bacterium]|nr:flagellar protein FlbB [Alphaproteobacteria bacterium]